MIVSSLMSLNDVVYKSDLRYVGIGLCLGEISRKQRFAQSGYSFG